MRQTRRDLGTMAMVVALLALLGACGKPKEEPPQPTKPRTDFAPEDFGIGKQHTPNAACNREIDALLDATRLCFNQGARPECDALQTRNSRDISRLKGMRRCAA